MNIAYYLSLAGEYQARRQGAAAAAVGDCSGDGGLSSYAPEIGSSCEDVVLIGNFCIQPEKKHGRLADTSAHNIWDTKRMKIGNPREAKMQSENNLKTEHNFSKPT